MKDLYGFEKDRLGNNLFEWIKHGQCHWKCEKKDSSKPYTYIEWSTTPLCPVRDMFFDINTEVKVEELQTSSILRTWFRSLIAIVNETLPVFFLKGINQASMERAGQETIKKALKQVPVYGTTMNDYKPSEGLTRRVLTRMEGYETGQVSDVAVWNTGNQPGEETEADKERLFRAINIKKKTGIYLEAAMMCLKGSMWSVELPNYISSCSTYLARLLMEREPVLQLRTVSGKNSVLTIRADANRTVHEANARLTFEVLQDKVPQIGFFVRSAQENSVVLELIYAEQTKEESEEEEGEEEESEAVGMEEEKDFEDDEDTMNGDEEIPIENNLYVSEEAVSGFEPIVSQHYASAIASSPDFNTDERITPFESEDNVSDEEVLPDTIDTELISQTYLPDNTSLVWQYTNDQTLPELPYDNTRPFIADTTTIKQPLNHKHLILTYVGEDKYEEEAEEDEPHLYTRKGYESTTGFVQSRDFVRKIANIIDVVKSFEIK